jgi:hypothetical protein
MENMSFWYMLIMHNIKISNFKCFEIVAKFKYLEMTVPNQNDITDEIRTIFNLENAC